MREKERHPDAMTGPELKSYRERVLSLTQVELAALMGIALRTYCRLEGHEYAESDIPLHHAKHVRCLKNSLKS